MRLIEPLLRRAVALRRAIVAFIVRYETASFADEASAWKRRCEEAEARANIAEYEAKVAMDALERMRAHYRADIAIQARVEAQGGLGGEKPMG
jgi:hypothetical protein